jgi:hypothetical protein
MQQYEREFTMSFTTDMGDHKITTTSALNADDVTLKLGRFARLHRRHQAVVRTWRGARCVSDKPPR